ncbi:MAG: hypothetical protein K6T86_07655 [Pirellulales bacterium]|nr:hypothetical protein [Pirellulales bacterium]
MRPQHASLWALLACSGVALCSCTAAGRHAEPAAPHGLSAAPQLPPEAYTGIQPASYEECLACNQPRPLGSCDNTWRPPGIACPWPPQEYLCDGGDQAAGVTLSPQWQLSGVDPQDTVAHYDSWDGRTLVEASNQVCIYAPKFGAVRTVTGLGASETRVLPAGVVLPDFLVQQDEYERAATSLQRYQAKTDLGTRLPAAYHSRQYDGVVSTNLHGQAYQDALLPYANLRVLRDGTMDQAEKARLTELTRAAAVWQAEQQVQVILDGMAAVEVVLDRQVEAVYTVRDPRKNPKLRLIKIASTDHAAVGEEVEFIIRFDNVGDQAIGNIVIVDNLVTRLEYIPGSAQASRDATFTVEENESRSLLLRWEFAEPLEPGEGGLVHFKCRVR